MGKFQRNVPDEVRRSRDMANIRERRRIAELRTAFDRLRKILPYDHRSQRKISRAEILRLSSLYIRHLSLLLKNEYTPTLAKEFEETFRKGP